MSLILVARIQHTARNRCEVSQTIIVLNPARVRAMFTFEVSKSNNMDGDADTSLLTRTSISGGIVGGLVHAGVGIMLWNHWFDSLWKLLEWNPRNAVYILLGLVLLGFVPVLFYLGQNVVSPAVIVGALLVISGVLSWLAGPVRAPAAVPTPFALYVLSWVGIVALAVVIGSVERRRLRQTAG